MRRVVPLFLSILLLAALIIPTSAETCASSVGVYATVSSDGSCQITQTVTLHLDQPIAELTYPLPREAASITLNGSWVRTEKTEHARLLNLSKIAGKVSGDVSFAVNYTLDDLIRKTEDQLLELRLPLLSGFLYPVQKLEFSVTMPGEFSGKPAFSSGYHQANIEKDLNSQVSGAVITGASLSELKDHETLEMILSVTEEMFPQSVIQLPTFDSSYLAIGITLALALLYWFMTLRCAPVRRMPQTLAPDGYIAGELGCVLHLEGTSLSLMVFSWAQLGYILIQPDRHGRVLLHKRMDMGNERSSFERRCFQSLFGKRSTVDTSGLAYATLCQKVSKLKPSLQSFVRPRSGNPLVFRGLAALGSLFCGACIGLALSTGAALQWLLVFLLSLYGLVCGWLIQSWAYRLLTKRGYLLPLLLSILFLLLGLLSGQFGVALLGCISQLLAGLMAAFGGRRTGAGRQAMSQVLGLRRYLRTVSKQELQRICQNNPEYFYDLAPHALALGVDTVFAKHFGRMQLPSCPYLTTGMDGHMTALEWSQLMQKTLKSMDARWQRLPAERATGILQSFIK